MKCTVASDVGVDPFFPGRRSRPAAAARSSIDASAPGRPCSVSEPGWSPRARAPPAPRRGGSTFSRASFPRAASGSRSDPVCATREQECRPRRAAAGRRRAGCVPGGGAARRRPGSDARAGGTAGPVAPQRWRTAGEQRAGRARRRLGRVRRADSALPMGTAPAPCQRRLAPPRSERWLVRSISSANEPPTAAESKSTRAGALVSRTRATPSSRRPRPAACPAGRPRSKRGCSGRRSSRCRRLRTAGAERCVHLAARGRTPRTLP